MLRSVNNIVIAPAKTGKDNKSKTAVTKTDHTNKGILSKDIWGERILITVVIKLTAPKIEEAPAKCKEKMVKSTELSPCPNREDKGGYTVHPVPAPPPIDEKTSIIIEGGRSQKLILFIRGKAISGAPIIKGTSQLPKPPIRIGITAKKIITNAWEVTKTL